MEADSAPAGAGTPGEEELGLGPAHEAVHEAAMQRQPPLLLCGKVSVHQCDVCPGHHTPSEQQQGGSPL